MQRFHGAALSRLVESGVFWKFPGKGAMLVEAQADQAMQRCKETLDGTRRHMEGWTASHRATKATPAQELFKKLEAEAPKPSGGLSYKLVAEDSSCFSNAGGAGDIHRLHLGNGMTLEACAEAVSKKCECGRGFEHDKGNDGYCGCGMAGTPNTDCTESDDDFSYGSARYIMFNPACLNQQSEARKRALEQANAAAGGEDGGGALAAAVVKDYDAPKKRRQVCFDVYD